MTTNVHALSCLSLRTTLSCSRFCAAITVIVISCSSCTRAVTPPLDFAEPVEVGALYQVVTVDGHTFETRDLVLGDDVVTFSSADQHYSFTRDKIKLIQRLEIDTSRTVAAVAVTAVAVGAVTYFLLKWFIESF